MENTLYRDDAVCICEDGYHGTFCQYGQGSTLSTSGPIHHNSPVFRTSYSRMNVFIIGAVVLGIVLGVVALCLFYFCFWRWRLMSRTDLEGQTVATRVHEVMVHSSRTRNPYDPMGCQGGTVGPCQEAEDVPPAYDNVSGKPPSYTEATTPSSEIPLTFDPERR